MVHSTFIRVRRLIKCHRARRQAESLSVALESRLHVLLSTGAFISTLGVIVSVMMESVGLIFKTHHSSRFI